MSDLREKILARVRVLGPAPNGCWEWTARVEPNGYGKVSVGRRRFWAHRVAYEAFRGPIPKGLQIDHLCRNRRCVNPAHLDPVTQQENLRRGDVHARVNAAKRARPTCGRGHVYTAATTRMASDGSRCCRVCARAHGAAARARKRAA